MNDQPQEVRLGASDDDERLAAALEAIAEQGRQDGRRTYSSNEWLKTCWKYCFAIPGKLLDIVAKGVNRFTEIESKRTLAANDTLRAEGEKEEMLANAHVSNAQAGVLEAQAAEVRADTARKDEVLAWLLDRGIDIDAEKRGDLMRIVFVKDEEQG